MFQAIAESRQVGPSAEQSFAIEKAFLGNLVSTEGRLLQF